jgi:MFS family permease
VGALPHDSYAALRFRNFRLLVFGRFIASLGEQMLGIAIGWELYELTNSTLALGIVGLVQVLPIMLFALPAGHVVDQFNRKRVVLISQALLILASLFLAFLSYEQVISSQCAGYCVNFRGLNSNLLLSHRVSYTLLALVYVCLFLIGIARSFNGPATSTLIPQTVPPDVFTNAATWGSSAWQLAAVLGPALGGLFIARTQSATFIYVLDAIMALIFFVLVAMIHSKEQARPREAMSVKSLAAGANFIWNTKVILAAITLDMFAVLLGGATALLPVYAKDILHVGAAGYGWLQAAPSIGALIMVLAIAHRPPFTHAGRDLLWAVIGFGVATIIFGLSTSFLLSLLMLGTLGALDNISVVIRSTLMLVYPPDEMRGRISAVNNVFIGTSNQLGGFESGLAASIFGTVPAVVGGGVGTILVVIAVGLIWPEIRRLGTLSAIEA